MYLNGVINVDKPSGMTSSDVVCCIRKIFSTRAVGHMGTLDPIGTGVLPIGIGKSTRLFDYSVHLALLLNTLPASAMKYNMDRYLNPHLYHP